MCLVLEEIAKLYAACANVVAHHQPVICCFMDGSNEMQREKHLPKVCRGDHLVGFALTEPAAGSNAFSLRTSAVP